MPNAEPDGWLHARGPADRARHVAARSARGAGTGFAAGTTRNTSRDSGRQRNGVHQPRRGSVGASESGGAALHRARGKPTQNALIESFNGKFRDECLNQNWFVDLRHAREVLEAWRVHYNTLRPHTSLKYLTPQHIPPPLS